MSKIDIKLNPPRAIVKVAPKSGRHRERVKELFLTAAQCLATGPGDAPTAPSTGLRPEVIALAGPALDSRFVDKRGLMRPFGEIRDIILGLDDAA